jgi:HK97 gp10 family phage protein
MPTPITNVTFIPNLAVGTQWEHSPEAMRCVAEQGAKVKDAAETIVPVDTGALRDSIELLVEGIATVATAWVGTTIRYGGYVEYGTSITPAQPFLRPALDTIAE